jgi:uncharacterized YigZ family protein
MENYYQTINEIQTAEFKDRGSKFIAYAVPLESVAAFKEKIKDIKTEHPKADHFCFAYRVGLTKNIFRVSDDGEPSGSAGKPILGQIDSKQLANILVVVVRYFGGTLLGVPGLINAYKTATSFALQTATIVQKEIVEAYTLEFDYTQMNEVMKIIKQVRGTIIQNESSLFSTIKVTIPMVELTTFIQHIHNVPGLVSKKE